MSTELKCIIHPDYKAVHMPRSGCECCTVIYYAARNVIRINHRLKDEDILRRAWVKGEV